MSWVVAGTMMAGTALVGAYSADEQRKAQVAANKQQGDMAAAQTQFSPWTGMPTGTAEMKPVTGNPVAGALQGGLSGAMMAQGMQKSAAEQDLLKVQAEEARKKAALQGWDPNRA